MKHIIRIEIKANMLLTKLYNNKILIEIKCNTPKTM